LIKINSFTFYENIPELGRINQKKIPLLELSFFNYFGSGLSKKSIDFLGKWQRNWS